MHFVLRKYLPIYYVYIIGYFGSLTQVIISAFQAVFKYVLRDWGLMRIAYGLAAFTTISMTSLAVNNVLHQRSTSA